MAQSLAALSFQGDKYIADLLENLGPEIREKAVPVALKAAGKKVVAKARKMVPVDKTADPAGTLKRSLGLVARGRKGRSKFVVFGPRRGFARQVTRPIIIRGEIKGGYTQNADPANYGHLVELGHHVSNDFTRGSMVKNRYTGRELSGAQSFVAPKPFLLPAMLSSKGEVRTAIVQELTSAQHRTASKLRRT